MSTPRLEPRAKYVALVGAGALLGSVSTIVVLKLLQKRGVQQCNKNTAELNSVERYTVTGKKNNKVANEDILNDEIVSEHLTRNIQFFGFESQRKVSASYVVVIGLGGVGSHAASMLLRSGVGKLLLVDFDQVSLSSLNRHAVATRADVGLPKAQCLKEHFLSIFPECQIDAKVLLYDASTEEEILSGHPHFVLDCIDNIDTKVALLAACVRRGLKVLSATGAGARADPTRIRIADLRESTNDPLSRAVRHRLRKDYGIEGGIPVVFSLEKPKAKLLPFRGPSGEEENPSDYQIVPGFRVRIIPVLGSIPAIFGQVMASYVLTHLAELQVQTEPVVNFDMDHYHTLHQRLIEHEETLYGSATQVQDRSTDQTIGTGQALPQDTPRPPLLTYRRRPRPEPTTTFPDSLPSSETPATPVHPLPASPPIAIHKDAALEHPGWRQAMLDEMTALHSNGTWDLVDVEEVMYIAKELWRGRSAREQFVKDVGRGMWRSVNELMLVRWDRTKPASVSNLILLKFKEADEHESQTLDDIKEKEPEFYSRVTAVLKRAELDFGL
ncbi:tRNA threonylcarbamoyladenosine dehydratase 2-like [Senna tora]|uniref:tRNA threonylcarbamoyladenosine dehydratase 2-like n=1 Tax=Senna tora TaxID=362788 RepID=A0A834U2G5_9FABA|nr:tRNA threonylcarbamoyladenosine dehydratase 2-like [Senna tora]